MLHHAFLELALHFGPGCAAKSSVRSAIKQSLSDI
jgi:hypothetical protein